MKKTSPPFTKYKTGKKEYPASTHKQIVSKDHPAFIATMPFIGHAYTEKDLVIKNLK